MATGITVRLDGNVAKGISSSYSVDEESTPVDVSDVTGAVGRITVEQSIPRTEAARILSKRLRRRTLQLEDAGRGQIMGRISQVSQNSSGTVTYPVDQPTIKFVVRRSVPPFSGGLGNYLEMLFELVGVTTGFLIDSSLQNIPVVYRGTDEDLWLHLKRILPLHHAEIAFVSNNIVVRPVRGRLVDQRRDIDFDTTLADNQLARYVEGYHYNTETIVDELVYPPGGWNEDVSVYQVDANETIEVELELSASVTSVEDPIVLDFVAVNANNMSAYCVTGNDDKPIMAAQWLDGGGSITLEIADDTETVIAKIHGANIPELAPFRIAAVAGPSDYYSSLRIVGSGVRYERTMFRMRTAVPDDLVTTEVVEVDNPNISTQAELLDALAWTLARYGDAGRQSLNVRSRGVQRKGDTGSYVYPTIGEFNAQATDEGWTTIADFNLALAAEGWDTIGEFNDSQFALVATDFVNQAFGNVAGARDFRDGMYWRIRKATLTPDTVSWSAEPDTIIQDGNDRWTGKTIADFNAAWDGFTVGDANIAPLERTL